MSSLVAEAIDGIPKSCRVRTCSREGCKIPMTGLSGPHCLIDMDCEQLSIPGNQARCDYIFVGTHEGSEWIAAVELKRGNVKVGEVRKQLQAGAEFAESRLPVKHDQPGFRPIAAYGGKLHKSQSAELKRELNMVKFGQVRYQIKLIRCGSPLVNALK